MALAKMKRYTYQLSSREESSASKKWLDSHERLVNWFTVSRIARLPASLAETTAPMI